MNRRDFVAAAGLMALAPSARAGEPPQKASTAPFRAGAAASNITPPLGTSMDGIIMRQGPVEQVHDELFARCLALDDGRTRLALCACDLCIIPREIMDDAKAIAHQRTGIPTSHMLVSATHTHSAPRIGCGTGEIDQWYFEFLTRRIADAIARAVHRLAPAQAGWGVGRKPEFTKNRRWLVKPGKMPINPFDETTDQVLMYGSRKGIGVKPAGPVDPEVSVLSVQHTDGRPLALLANYSIHYVTSMGRTVSADYFGLLCRRLEEVLGSTEHDPPFVALMSNGTFGDTGGVGGGYANVRKVAYAVADEALRVRKEIEHRAEIALAMEERELDLAVRRPDQPRLAWAKAALADPRHKKGQHPWRVKYAQDAVRLSQWPPTVSIKLQAIRIGGLGIAAIPCEPFAETGLAIKRESPLKPTFTIGLANGYRGYLPTPRDHELGGYETWTGRGSHLEVQAEPKIRAAVLELLRQVAPNGQVTATQRREK